MSIKINSSGIHREFLKNKEISGAERETAVAEADFWFLIGS